MRIVSLLPSTTEICFALGAGDEVVGVTAECDFPPEARTRRVVSLPTLPAGATPSEIDAAVRGRLAAGEELYRLDEGALAELDPDLVLSQDLCAVCAVEVSTVEQALGHLGCTARVLTVDPSSLEEVLTSIATIGEAVGRAAAAAGLLEALRHRLRRVADAVAGRPPPPVAVLEWTDPLYSAGHWVADLAAAAGAREVLGEAGGRSRPVSVAELSAAEPELVVVAPCGFGLAGAAALAEQLLESGGLPGGIPIWAADADGCFVRPGPRLVEGIEALAAVCHPSVLPARPEVVRFVGTTSAKAKPSRTTTSPTLTSRA